MRYGGPVYSQVSVSVLHACGPSCPLRQGTPNRAICVWPVIGRAAGAIGPTRLDARPDGEGVVPTRDAATPAKSRPLTSPPERAIRLGMAATDAYAFHRPWARFRRMRVPDCGVPGDTLKTRRPMWSRLLRLSPHRSLHVRRHATCAIGLSPRLSVSNRTCTQMNRARTHKRHDEVCGRGVDSAWLPCRAA